MQGNEHSKVLPESLSNITVLMRSKMLASRSGTPHLSNCICHQWMMNNEYMASHERQVCEKEPYDTMIALPFWILSGTSLRTSVWEKQRRVFSMRKEKPETDSHHSTGKNLETSFPVKSMMIMLLAVYKKLLLKK